MPLPWGPVEFLPRHVSHQPRITAENQDGDLGRDRCAGSSKPPDCPPLMLSGPAGLGPCRGPGGDLEGYLQLRRWRAELGLNLLSASGRGRS